jgi:hypothetical protein
MKEKPLAEIMQTIADKENKEQAILIKRKTEN